MVEKEKGMNIKCLRSNGRGKYFSNESMNIWKNKEFKKKNHVIIPHNRMELLKRIIGTLQK